MSVTHGGQPQHTLLRCLWNALPASCSRSIWQSLREVRIDALLVPHSAYHNTTAALLMSALPSLPSCPRSIWQSLREVRLDALKGDGAAGGQARLVSRGQSGWEAVAAAPGKEPGEDDSGSGSEGEQEDEQQQQQQQDNRRESADAAIEGGGEAAAAAADENDDDDAVITHDSNTSQQQNGAAGGGKVQRAAAAGVGRLVAAVGDDEEEEAAAAAAGAAAAGGKVSGVVAVCVCLLQNDCKLNWSPHRQTVHTLVSELV
jgi:hypothetical protein